MATDCQGRNGGGDEEKSKRYITKGDIIEVWGRK